jgi:hypothetical protein
MPIPQRRDNSQTPPQVPRHSQGTHAAPSKNQHPNISISQKAPEPNISISQKAPEPNISILQKAPEPNISISQKAPEPNISSITKYFHCKQTQPFNNTPVNANIFCFAALADKNLGTIYTYTDCTGNLPTRALNNQQLFFVAYHYDINYISALPIESTKGDNIIAASSTIFNTLTEK